MNESDPLPALRNELARARQQEAATRRILDVVRQSRESPQPVFDAIASAAVDLFHAALANVLTFDGALVHLASTSYAEPRKVDDVRAIFPRPLGRDIAGARAIVANEVVEITDVDSDPEYTVSALARSTGFRSILAAPLVSERQPIGAVVVGRAEVGAFAPRDRTLLQTLADHAVIAIENARLFNELQRETEAHRRSKATIAAMVDDRRTQSAALVGSSAVLRQVRERIERVAATDSTVLILGETGTGKEVAARSVHAASRRGDRPLIVVNCAAMPRELVESELFGHERGAFTGALQQRRGRFELADGGTLFLDEVGELSLDTQAKLLRVLQDGVFERVGGSRPVRSDVRIIAATNRDLLAEVGAGRFRADLFYRLHVFPITLPPLRERHADLPELASFLVARVARRLGRPAPTIGPDFLRWAQTYTWPGNVRELENTLERLLITSDAPTLGPGEAAAPDTSRVPASVDRTLEAVERDHVRRVLEARQWKVEGEAGAARALALSPSTLRGLMRRHGIRRPQ